MFALGYFLGISTFFVLPELFEKTKMIIWLEQFIYTILDRYNETLKEDRSIFMSKIETHILECNADITKIKEKLELSDDDSKLPRRGSF
jgi:hypothetical protein